MKLKDRKIQPHEETKTPISLEEKHELLSQIHSDWSLTHQNTRLKREFAFDDFKDSFHFVKLIAELSEKEWHHPKVIFSYGRATIQLQTASLNDLAENDFIFAAKVDEVFFEEGL